MSTDDGARTWLLDRALNHGDRDQRRAALLLLLDGEVSNDDLPYVAPWAIPPFLVAVDNVRERFGDMDIPQALARMADLTPPMWAGDGAAMVSMMTLMVAALRQPPRVDDVRGLLVASRWYADVAPTYTVTEALDAVEWAGRYGGSEYASPATLLGTLGMDSLLLAREVGGRDAEEFLCALLDDDEGQDYSARLRADRALTWATVLRDNGIPCDGSERWARMLGALSKANPTVDEALASLPDEDTLALIEHFTIDGEPLAELILAAVDVPEWMQPWIGA